MAAKLTMCDSEMTVTVPVDFTGDDLFCTWCELLDEANLWGRANCPDNLCGKGIELWFEYAKDDRPETLESAAYWDGSGSPSNVIPDSRLGRAIKAALEYGSTLGAVVRSPLKWSEAPLTQADVTAGLITAATVAKAAS